MLFYNEVRNEIPNACWVHNLYLYHHHNNLNTQLLRAWTPNFCTSPTWHDSEQFKSIFISTAINRLPLEPQTEIEMHTFQHRTWTNSRLPQNRCTGMSSSQKYNRHKIDLLNNIFETFNLCHFEIALFR